ncbi:MAG: glycosyltransferase, partial [Candidatus Woesearchaeota archaeon]
PFEVKLEVTPMCNLDCAFCYNRNSFSRDLPELSTEEIKSAIDKIAKHNIAVRFSGGEPMMRKDIFDLFGYAKSKGLYVMLNTNSLLIDFENIKKFKGKIDHILLPFHELDKKLMIKKKNIASILKNYGVNVQLNTVLTKDNIRDIEKFCKCAKLIDAYWFLARPVPTKGNEHPINNEDVKTVIEKLLQMKMSGKVEIDGIPFCAYDPEKVKLFSRGSSSCGIFNKMVMDPSGKIKPCYSINHEIGKISENSILESWNNEFTKNIRNLKTFPEECKLCNYLYECLGGCRFAAKLINSDYSALDPLADIKNVFPFVSVVVPTYNRKENLSLVIRSLLKQEYPKKRYEIIVADDGSSDNTKELVKKYQKDNSNIKYVFQEDKGFRAGQARNLGAKKAKGNYLIFINDDIIPMPNLIKNYAKELNSHDIIIGYTSGYTVNDKIYDSKKIKNLIDSDYQKLKKLKLIHEFRDSWFDNKNMNTSEKTKDIWKIFTATNFAIKKEIFDKEKFDERFSGWGVEDEEWSYRMMKKGYSMKASKRCITIHLPHEHEKLNNIYTDKKVDSMLINFMLFYKIHTEKKVEDYIYERYVHLPEEFKNKKREEYIKNNLENIKN